MTAEFIWRRQGVKAGPGYILNDRWEVWGRDRYWEVVDDADGRRYPSDSLGDLPSYFRSMREARAEDLARDAS